MARRLTASVRLRTAEVGDTRKVRERRGVPVAGVWRITRGRRGVGRPVEHERATSIAVSSWHVRVLLGPPWGARRSGMRATSGRRRSSGPGRVPGGGSACHAHRLMPLAGARRWGAGALASQQARPRSAGPRHVRRPRSRRGLPVGGLPVASQAVACSGRGGAFATTCHPPQTVGYPGAGGAQGQSLLRNRLTCRLPRRGWGAACGPAVRWVPRGGGGGCRAAGRWSWCPHTPGVVQGAHHARVVPVAGLGLLVVGVVAGCRVCGGRSGRGHVQAGHGGVSGPNNALEPTAPNGWFFPCVRRWVGAAAHRGR